MLGALADVDADQWLMRKRWEEQARVQARILREALEETLARPAPVYEAAPPQSPQTPAPVQQLVRGPNGTDTRDSVYTVSGGAALWPLSVMCRLVASAAVADRTVALEYRTGDGLRYLVAGTQAVVQAGVTQSFCWHPQAGSVTWPVEDAAIAPLPQQHVYPGSALALKIGNGQSGDVLDTVLISARFDPLAE